MILDLSEFAECQFQLDKRQKDGATLRQHLEMAYKATGIMPEQLANEIEIPNAAKQVWIYFIDLHEERTSNGFGPNRLTSTAIKDWCELNRIKLERWEVKAIRALDKLWMESL